MELAISAVASDLVSRFISSVLTKFSSSPPFSEEKVDRLRRLLLRAHTVVEEAEARRITNSGMLLLLKTLEDAMYRGYHALDTFRFRDQDGGDEVRDDGYSSALYFATLKRFCRNVSGATNYRRFSDEHAMQRALGNLEAVVADMTEFVVLLGGCERMSRRPYDTYLYMENFMFGRHAEKQRVINVLLDDDHNLLSKYPAVIPVIGGRLVGKKTLVAHVCSDERVRSRFSSIQHLDGDNFQTIDRERCTYGRSLIVVEFTSDVSDEDWEKFYSSATSMRKGSKVILISRLENLSRFGTVKPIFINNLSNEEYSYLFKVISFGSARMDDHPRLASMAHEFPMVIGGSLVSAYAIADLLRKNMSIRFWLSVLTRCRSVVEKNISMFGEHPKLLLERGRPTDITKLVSPCAGQLRLLPPRDDTGMSVLPTVTFEELLADHGVLTKGGFHLVTWESRIAPYAKYVYFVPACAEEKKYDDTLSKRRKRRAEFV